MLVESVNTTQDPKKVRCTLIGAYPMVKEIIPRYPTHGESHPLLYESYHRDDDFPHFSVRHYLFWRTVLQSNLLRDVVFSLKDLYFGRGVY